MKLCRCPICRSEISLDQLIEDDAGREMLVLISELKSGVARPLVNYIALFRPLKTSLSNTRALKLMREVLEIYAQTPLLAHALSETVNAVRKNRRDNTNPAPLANHNYLKQVYEAQAPKFSGTIALSNAEKGKTTQTEQSKKQQAFAYIEQMRGFGQPIENLPYYAEWLKWTQQLKGGENE